MIPFKTLLPAVGLFLYAGVANADESTQYTKLLNPILESGKTVLGDPIAYPAGTPKVTAATVVLPIANGPPTTVSDPPETVTVFAFV